MNQSIKQAFILCGGLGTRLRPFTESNPKPMAPCDDKPFLEYIIEQLVDLGITEIVLATGYLGDKIEKYFGDGSGFNCRIIYSQGPVEWLTGYRTFKASIHFQKQFLLLYSDNFAVYPLDKAIKLHKLNASAVTLLTVNKSPGNINANNGDGLVTVYQNSRRSDLKYVEIGYMIIERDIFLKYLPSQNIDLSIVLEKIAASKLMSAINTDDCYYSISDPERWKLAEDYLRPKKIIFLDRDGVLNKKKLIGEYVYSWEDFDWIESTRESLIKLAKVGYKFIVITNQAGIARGICNREDVKNIHDRLRYELKLDGVEILDFYLCPHGWDEGCACRKPKPGMLFAASRDHKIRLDKTCFVGDDIRDMEAANASNCKGILYDESMSLYDEVEKMFKR